MTNLDLIFITNQKNETLTYPKICYWLEKNYYQFIKDILIEQSELDEDILIKFQIDLVKNQGTSKEKTGGIIQDIRLILLKMNLVNKIMISKKVKIFKNNRGKNGD